MWEWAESPTHSYAQHSAAQEAQEREEPGSQPHLIYQVLRSLETTEAKLSMSIWGN